MKKRNRELWVSGILFLLFLVAEVQALVDPTDRPGHFRACIYGVGILLGLTSLILAIRWRTRMNRATLPNP
jgi:hypothetical protein